MVIGSSLDDGALGRVSDLTRDMSTLLTEPDAIVVDESDLDRLRRGITLEGRSTRSCEIKPMRTTAGRGEGNAWFTVTLREGRSRQIRRMFEAIGHQVSKLKRVAIGPIRDEKLLPGEMRRLTAEEVASLRASLARTAPAAPPAAAARRKSPSKAPRRAAKKR